MKNLLDSDGLRAVQFSCKTTTKSVTVPVADRVAFGIYQLPRFFHLKPLEAYISVFKTAAASSSSVYADLSQSCERLNLTCVCCASTNHLNEISEKARDDKI